MAKSVSKYASQQAVRAWNMSNDGGRTNDRYSSRLQTRQKDLPHTFVGSLLICGPRTTPDQTRHQVP